MAVLYDQIVYIVKRGINIFSKKGFLRLGHNVAKGGGTQFFFVQIKWPPPPPTLMLSYTPERQL